jgi:8-amino-7-oxononanoate synthase
MDYPAFETPEGPRVTIAGRAYDWFRGNGYLGLFGDREVLRAACEATLRYGMKLRDKRAIGCHPCLLELERQALRFFGSEGVAYYGSGYAGGAIMAAALADLVDVAFVDEEAHYGVFDGLVLTGKPIVRFAHRDPDDLARRLRAHLGAGQRPLLMSDGIFPITGAIAPVPEYWSALAPYEGALLCLDDAHAYGVLGARGRGTLEHFDLAGEPRYSFGTMSKAFGAFGGILAGSVALIERVQATNGVMRGASKPPPGAVAAAAKALEIVNERPELRRRLGENVAHTRAGLAAMGLDVDARSPSPILSIGAASGLRFAELERALFVDEGIAVLHVERGYTGIPRGGVLVITIFANHEPAQLDRLLDALRRRV